MRAAASGRISFSTPHCSRKTARKNRRMKSAHGMRLSTAGDIDFSLLKSSYSPLRPSFLYGSDIAENQAWQFRQCLYDAVEEGDVRHPTASTKTYPMPARSPTTEACFRAG